MSLFVMIGFFPLVMGSPSNVLLETLRITRPSLLAYATISRMRGREHGRTFITLFLLYYNNILIYLFDMPQGGEKVVD